VGVDEHTIEVAGAPVFYRRAPATGATALYLHSVPTSSDDWVPFLQESGGIAPDLLGFGRSSKAGSLDYTLPTYVDFVEAFLAAVGVQRVALVGHGWGAAIGLGFAQRHPERIERVAIIDAVPLLEGFQWPRLVRRWRRPALGELLMGSVSERLLARTLRGGAADPGAWSNERVAAVWEQFDQGTQRAILRLHRSIDPQGLAEAGAGLAQLDAPALVLWGERDPWLEPSFADAYAQRLPRATLERVAEAGHWPWLDQPAVIERVATFVSAATAGP
jgi:pimeloyl-ACP methyl ester carboxylesterase